MKVEDVMIPLGNFPAVPQKAILKEALTEMGEANLGLVCIINEIIMGNLKKVLLLLAN